MERRKLLVGLGVLGAGGVGAFGTEAFTSVEANRNVDVSVAGDASAYLAIKPTDGSANADAYVSTESDNTVSIELDGDDAASGSGVNQDAVTEIDELLTLINQGTQPVGLYVKEDSSAVTFRADGSSLEGPSNAIDLGVGESVVIGITVDTVNTDVSGSLLDTVTFVATADSPTAIAAPTVGSFDAVVNPDGNADYETIQAAVDGESTGATIGLGADVTVSSSVIQIDKEGITLASKSGRKTVRNEGLSGNADGSVLEITAADVTVQGVEVVTAAGVTSNNQAPREIDIQSGGSNATILDNVVRRPDGSGGTAIKGTPEIAVRGGVSGVTVRGNMLTGGAIGLNGATGSVVGNTVESVSTEGVYAFGYSEDPSLTIQTNIVNDHDASNGGAREIKVSASSATINNEDDGDAQFESLLSENEVNSVRVDGSDGVTVDADGSGNVYPDLGTGISEAGQGGYVRVFDGRYGGTQIDQQGVTITSVAGTRPAIDASVGVAQGTRIVNFKADNATIRGFEIVGTDSSRSAVTVPFSNCVVEDILARDLSTGVDFSSGSSDNTARFVTVQNAKVGVTPSGGTGHLVERCDFTGVADNKSFQEGLGVSADGVESRNNNYGEDVKLRVYESDNLPIDVLSDGDFFGQNGEDGEVVANDGTIDDATVTVQNVTTSPNDAGIR